MPPMDVEVEMRVPARDLKGQSVCGLLEGLSPLDTSVFRVRLLPCS